ncbi:MAG: hypothetical protein SVX43_12760 [Cyanobacteriota bacterium]|nr:hypothetical protein [Cyanobacteriota bacterium]
MAIAKQQSLQSVEIELKQASLHPWLELRLSRQTGRPNPIYPLLLFLRIAIALAR